MNLEEFKDVFACCDIPSISDEMTENIFDQVAFKKKVQTNAETTIDSMRCFAMMGMFCNATLDAKIDWASIYACFLL
tara:strand:+ start:147 stop:377 length:231 start_codon:yes stop_codon:yes gene_type:complete